MTRGQKKFAYGFFYLIILGFIIWIFIPSSNAPRPPVCSGLSCPAEPLPLQVSGAPQIFKSESAHRVIVLGQVTNPNPDYGADTFSYNFKIFDRDGKTIASVLGSEKIYPAETKYILGSDDVGSADISSLAERPGFEIGNANFRPAAGFLKPNWILTSSPVTQIDPSGIKVSGNLENKGVSSPGGVKVMAILGNKYGDPVFAAETLVQNPEAFKDAPFEVHFPADQLIIQSADTSKTEVFLDGESVFRQ